MFITIIIIIWGIYLDFFYTLNWTRLEKVRPFTKQNSLHMFFHTCTPRKTSKPVSMPPTQLLTRKVLQRRNHSLAHIFSLSSVLSNRWQFRLRISCPGTQSSLLFVHTIAVYRCWQKHRSSCFKRQREAIQMISESARERSESVRERRIALYKSDS